MNSAATARSTSTRSVAVHTWPVSPKAPAATSAAARGRSASAQIRAALWPPSSNWTRTPGRTARCSAAPVRSEPVNVTARTSGAPASAAMASGSSPWTTRSASSGTPPRRQAAASRSPAPGVTGDGLKTTVLPAASAGAILRAARDNGKFHGVMATTTPSGTRSVHADTPADSAG